MAWVLEVFDARGSAQKIPLTGERMRIEARPGEQYRVVDDADRGRSGDARGHRSGDDLVIETSGTVVEVTGFYACPPAQPCTFVVGDDTLAAGVTPTPAPAAPAESAAAPAVVAPDAGGAVSASNPPGRDTIASSSGSVDDGAPSKLWLLGGLLGLAALGGGGGGGGGGGASTGSAADNAASVAPMPAPAPAPSPAPAAGSVPLEPTVGSLTGTPPVSPPAAAPAPAPAPEPIVVPTPAPAPAPAPAPPVTTISGGSRDDSIDVTSSRADQLHNGTLAIDGGAGTDTLRLRGSGTALDLTSVPDANLRNIERIALDGPPNTVTLRAGDVLSLGGALSIDGNSNDTVSARGFRGTGDDTRISGVTYDVYVDPSSGARLLIDHDIRTILL